MTKHEGYQCDGGCGESLVIDPIDSTTKHGWYRTFTPRGERTLDTCSAECLARALSTFCGMRGLRLPNGDRA